MMEKLAQAGEGGGWEGRYTTLPLFLLYPYMLRLTAPKEESDYSYGWESFDGG